MIATQITYVKGDATAPEGKGPKIIVHCCNDAGLWGRGFVVALSKKWPQPEARYREARPYKLGDIQWVYVNDEITVVNIIGQHGVKGNNHQTPPIRYAAIRLGLQKVFDGCKGMEAIVSVHMPRIGCGLAGGKWERIEPIIQAELCDKGIPVTVYDLPSTP